MSVLFEGNPYADPETEMAENSTYGPPGAPSNGEPGASGEPGAQGARGPSGRGRSSVATVPTVSGEALKFIAMIFVLIILYDVVTHGTAWSGVFANISSHLANFVSVKPLATVQTTTAAWSNVL